MEKLESYYKACKILDSIFTNQFNVNIFSDVINETYKAKNTKGFQYVFKDMYDGMKDMLDFRPDKLRELNMFLISECGDYIKELINSDAKLIKKVIKHDKINNDNEYQIILARVEEIYQDESKKEEVEKLNNLLVEYLKKKKA